MPKNQLSVVSQIALVLGCLLVFSLMFSFAGYMGANQQREQMAAFAADGTVATGSITNKRMDIVRPTAGAIQVYWLDLTFRTGDGTLRGDSIEVANSIYDHYQIGDPVRVTYSRSHPEWFYIPGAEPTERSLGISAGMNSYGLGLAFLSAIGLVVLFFTTRRGSKPPAETPSFPAPAATAVRQMPSGPRSSFGTRVARK